MSDRLLTCCAMVACLMSGCVCSVHPILLETDLSTDLDLTGTWEPVITAHDKHAADAKKAYSFVAKKYSVGVESDYDVVWNGKEFHGQIGKIAGDYYLQLRRTELKPEIQPLLHAVPVFAIAKLRLTDDNTIEVLTIDEVCAPQLLGDNKLTHLRYTPSHPIEYFVLTESTEAMQARFEQSGDQIFTKLSRFTRAKETGEPSNAPKLQSQPN